MSNKTQNEIISSKIRLSTGTAINKDMYYMSGTFDELEENEDGVYTRMMIYQDQTNEKWFHHDLPDWRIVSTYFPTIGDDGIRRIYALSEQGDVECYCKLGATQEKIADAGLLFTGLSYGYATRIREIGSHLYVCGYRGQVYRRETNGWVHCDENLLQKEIPSLETEDPEQLRKLITLRINETICLTDINGTNENDMYVVGIFGFMSHFNGIEWRKINPVTNEHLNSIFIDDNEMLWIAGAKGILLHGNLVQGFKIVAENNFELDFYSITKFHDVIYIASSDGIYSFQDNNLKKLSVNNDYNLTEVSHIEAKDGVLWALTERKVLRFDGEIWQVFENPHNV